MKSQAACKICVPPPTCSLQIQWILLWSSPESNITVLLSHHVITDTPRPQFVYHPGQCVGLAAPATSSVHPRATVCFQQVCQKGFVWGHCVSWAMLLMPDLTPLNKLFHSRERPVMLFQLFSYTQMYPFNYDKSFLQWPSTGTAMCYRLTLLLPAVMQKGDPHTSERAGHFYKCSFSCFYTMCDNGKDLLLLLTTTGWKAIFILSDISPLV